MERMLEDQTTTSGSGLKISGICLIIAGGVLYAILGGPDDNPAGLLGPIVMIVGLLMYFRGRQKAAKARAANSQGPIHDSKADVLYLRSFQTDTSTAFKKVMSGLTTEEEQLAEVLRPFGDMVAIGRPGESLPLPGAARIYATDSEWKGVVLAHMRSAPLVVIRAGTGTGLFWEFEQAFSTLPPAKIVVFVMNITKREYSAFADQMRDSFQVALPAIGSFSLLRAAIDLRDNPSKVLPGFVCFSDDWSPEFLPLPSTIIRLGYNDSRKSFNLALRPVFERHGVAWQPLGRFQA
jgi:hypothetical protein